MNVINTKLWYKLRIRNKSLMEEAKDRLKASSFDHICLTDDVYFSSSIQHLAKTFELSIYVYSDLETLEAFLATEKSNKTYKLFKSTNSMPVTYDEQTVRQTQAFFQDYNGEFRIVSKIPSKAKECTIKYLQLPELTGYYQNVQKAQIDKFYIRLLEDLIVFIPVPKETVMNLTADQEEEEKRKKEEEENKTKSRWMILRTYDEEDWNEKLSRWNENMAEAIKEGKAAPCSTFLPRRKEIDRNGKERTKLLCSGYLFIKTTVNNLHVIETELDYGIPSIRRAVIQERYGIDKEKEKEEEKGKGRGKEKSNSKEVSYVSIKPAFIRENAMTTFMFASEIESGELEYDLFDYCIDKNVVYTCKESPFYGKIGKLSRKGKDLYIVFSFGNMCGNIRMPGIKVETHQIRKLTEEEKEMNSIRKITDKR